jgi:hypothetical protein
LIEILDELGLAKPAREHLAAEVAATSPEVRVARAIRRFLAPTFARKFGEIVGESAADPRPARLAALLGDALCAPAPARIAAEIAAWIHAHDIQALIDHGDCVVGSACRWAHPSTPTLEASCSAGKRGYVLAAWHYTAGEARLTRNAVFYLASTVAPIVTSTLAGNA